MPSQLPLREPVSLLGGDWMALESVDSPRPETVRRGRTHSEGLTTLPTAVVQVDVKWIYRWTVQMSPCSRKGPIQIEQIIQAQGL